MREMVNFKNGGKSMRKLSVTFMLFIIFILAVGCSVDDETAPADAGAEDATAEDADSSDDTIRIGALWPSAEIPPVQSKMEATEEMAEELGVELINMDAQFDAQTQSEQARNLLAQQVDGVLVDLIDPQAIVPALKELHEAGIPVITTSMPVAPEGEEYVTSFIGADNYENGFITAKHLSELLGEDGGKVALIEGAPSILVQENTEGFEAGIEGTNIEIVDVQSSDWDRQEAMDIMQDYLTKYDDLDAIFVYHDNMVPGAYQAMKQVGREDDIIIMGYGATIEGMELIEDGTIAGSAVEDLWWQAQEGVKRMVEVIEGGDIPKEIIGEVKLITKDNLDEYESRNH